VQMVRFVKESQLYLFQNHLIYQETLKALVPSLSFGSVSQALAYESFLYAYQVGHR
jgi:hypothetical protein